MRNFIKNLKRAIEKTYVSLIHKMFPGHDRIVREILSYYTFMKAANPDIDALLDKRLVKQIRRFEREMACLKK